MKRTHRIKILTNDGKFISSTSCSEANIFTTILEEIEFESNKDIKFEIWINGENQIKIADVSLSDLDDKEKIQNIWKKIN